MSRSTELSLDFSLPGTEGDEISEYRLSDHTAGGAAVLVFYPFDFSPVCTAEICGFRDAEWLSFTENVDVLGISRDSCYAHKRFIEEYNLSFPLLSDTQGEVIEQFDVMYDEWDYHRDVPKRALVTLDESHDICYKWQTEDAYETPDMDELEQSVLSLLDGAAR
ncbi:redoxin domain-containing protein [Halobaculum rubrum]|uniref:redoxin domain-containing protein n=1 Tax=Halobaculum rubrum TaxID=2872158 RepID=UPI001CA41D74|nr:redoxin domain-containing protein [Halobaculum rubrum]QZY00080.1 redoxin domain-containing protein [Halobaculum rubrum]